jgi:hypothetical protein
MTGKGLGGVTESLFGSGQVGAVQGASEICTTLNARSESGHPITEIRLSLRDFPQNGKGRRPHGHIAR